MTLNKQFPRTTVWMSLPSVQLVWRESVKQLSATPLNSLKQGKGQTTGNLWAPKYYIFPIYDLPHRPPLKKIRKIPTKFHAKAIQGHVPWLNLKKNFRISFSQYANNVETLLFRSMRQAQNTDTHTLNQLGVFQNSLPLWSNFTADKHIWHPPWAWM